MKPWVKLFIIIADELAIIILILAILMYFGLLDLLYAVGLGLAVSAIVLAITVVAMKPQLAKPKVGSEALIGKEGIVSEIKGPGEALVFIDGEYWLAKVEGKVLKGDKVLVTGVEGLILKVRRA
ncbi:MAG: hypothetical protein DRO23_05715 [Thermoprotei archaeon]|nr:MAG: hypothetical protein DRO23_05715 [Thermoprotei archaeon]